MTAAEIQSRLIYTFIKYWDPNYGLSSSFMLKSYRVGGGLQDFSVSPSPLWVNWGFKLGWTGLGLGLEGLGTNGVGVGD